MLMQKMTTKILAVISIICISLTQTMSVTLASEISISGNGPDSQSTASVSQESSTTVVQNNDADVQNQVQTDANTGNNSASSNTGENTAITTGNADTNLSIENSGNVSEAQIECCPNGETSVNILGNGDNSDNTVNLNNNSQTNIYITQNANISNNVYGSANTGNNTADNNNGNVSIDTGDIKARGEVRNDGFNIASVRAPQSSGQGFDIKIAQNGVDSQNTINHNFNNNTYVSINNYSNLENILNWDLNTGGNRANRNNGNVKIKTGNIFLDVILENKINISDVDIECCKPTPAPTPTPSTSPSPTPTPPSPPCKENCNPPGGDNPCRENCGGGSSNPGGGGPGGSVLGVTNLPATGNNVLIGLTLLATLIMVYGAQLRKNTYVKPAYTLRFKYNTLHL